MRALLPDPPRRTPAALDQLIATEDKAQKAAGRQCRDVATEVRDLKHKRGGGGKGGVTRNISMTTVGPGNGRKGSKESDTASIAE